MAGSGIISPGLPPAGSSVLVIGGGVVGVACADELANRGLKVTLIDKGEVGHGCSYGNAGWLSPCFATPLGMPGMLGKSISWLLDRDSPLYIQPRLNLELLRWLLRFAGSMNRPQMRRSIENLTALALYSLEAYKQLDQEQPGAFGFQQKGLLAVAQTAAALHKARQEMEMVVSCGVAAEAVDHDQLLQIDPAVTGKVVGGVWYPKEAHVEPLATVKALAKRATDRGATILPNTEVFDLSTRGRRIEAVHTTNGVLRADQIVLATGVWSNRLARRLSLRVPVLGGKGYAVVIEPFQPAPRMPIMLIEKKVAVTPRADSIRLAGTLELVEMDESITTRRVNAILRGARQYLHVPAEPKIVEIWCGLRPCTPDGVPVIGRPSRFDNLVVATGHQMLGLLTAPGTARLVADLLAGKDPLFDPHPFRATRF